MPVDPCFAEILSDPRNTVRPPPDHVPIDKVRRVADDAMDQGDIPALAEILNEVVRIGDRDIPIRHYRPCTGRDLPVVVFCHGGGFVWGSIDTHDGLCRRLAVETGAAVISVGYRLAPETRFPGPVEDVMGVLRDLSEHAPRYGIDPSAIALCGDSAGGGICVSVAGLAARVGVRLCHLGLFYPALDPKCATPSQHAFADGPLLTKAAMEWFWSCYLGPDCPPGFSPLPRDLAGFPPTTIATAEYDPLRDEGEDFHRLLLGAGVESQLMRVAGMVHGYLSLPATSATIEAAFKAVAGRLRLAVSRSSKEP